MTIHTQHLTIALISLGLGLFLVSLLLAIYVEAHAVYRLSQGLARMRESGRLALEWLSRDIRLAGFIGCPRLIETPLNRVDFTAANSLVGWHQKHRMVTILPSGARDSAWDSDVLLIQTADPHTVAIRAAHGREIHFSQSPPFVLGDPLIISDCRQAEIFYLGRSHLQHTYQNDAVVAYWHKIVYYVADTKRKNQAGHTIYALYRHDLNAPASKPIELIESVAKLELRYGLKSASSTFDYVLADAVKDWRQVRSVQVTLLIASVEDLAMGSIEHLLADHRYRSPTDRRLRQEWRQIVALREREGWTINH